MSPETTKSRLYYYPGNANLAPHILLEEVGCEYELVLVDRARQEQKSAEYLRINPNGTIPAWVEGSLVLFEAAAVCLHLADLHPAARLAPPFGSAARAGLYKWMFFLSNTVQPAYMAFRYPEKHARLPLESVSGADGAEVREAVQASAAERTQCSFDVIEQALTERGPFLLGSEYSACDAYLYMLAWWAQKLPQPPAQLPGVRRCVQAVAAREATRRACAAEGIELYEPDRAS